MLVCYCYGVLICIRTTRAFAFIRRFTTIITIIVVIAIILLLLLLLVLLESYLTCLVLGVWPVVYKKISTVELFMVFLQLFETPRFDFYLSDVRVCCSCL